MHYICMQPKPTPPGSPSKSSPDVERPVSSAGQELPAAVTRLARTSVKPLLEDDNRGSQPSEGPLSDVSTAPEVPNSKGTQDVSAPATPTSLLKLPLPPAGADEDQTLSIVRNLAESMSNGSKVPESVFSKSAVEEGIELQDRTRNQPPPTQSKSTIPVSKSTIPSMGIMSQAMLGAAGSKSEIEQTTKDSNNPFDASELSDPFLYTESNTLGSRNPNALVAAQGPFEEIANRTFVPKSGGSTRRRAGV